MRVWIVMYSSVGGVRQIAVHLSINVTGKYCIITLSIYKEKIYVE